MWTLTHFNNTNWLLIKDKDYFKNYIDIKNTKEVLKLTELCKKLQIMKRKNYYHNKPIKKIIGNITKQQIYSYYEK